MSGSSLIAEVKLMTNRWNRLLASLFCH